MNGKCGRVHNMIDVRLGLRHWRYATLVRQAGLLFGVLSPHCFGIGVWDGMGLLEWEETGEDTDIGMLVYRLYAASTR